MFFNILSIFVQKFAVESFGEEICPICLCVRFVFVFVVLIQPALHRCHCCLVVIIVNLVLTTFSPLGIEAAVQLEFSMVLCRRTSSLVVHYLENIENFVF